MTAVLGIDTASPMLSVAVRIGGDDSQVWSTQVAAGRETGALLPGAVTEMMAHAGLAPRELTAIAVGVGPGPYTSLRVGLMFARAAAAALGISVVGACSLDIVARGLPRRDADVIVALDARRREVYWARYDAAGVRTVGPFVGKAAEIAVDHPGVEWITGATPAAAVLTQWAVTERLVTSATEFLEDDPNGVGGSAVTGTAWVPQTLLVPVPLYLRRPDATEPVQPMPGAQLLIGAKPLPGVQL